MVRLLWVTLVLAGLSAGQAVAQQPSPRTMIIGYLSQEEEIREPISFVDPILTDEGVQGARLGAADNNTTGRFTGQTFELAERVVPRDGDVAEAFRELAGDGVRLFVADLPADRLLAIADLPEARDKLIFNARARDDALRNEQCRSNVLHVAPSRNMVADGLGQYLAFKRWTRWFLVVGQEPEDKAYAEAVRRAAKRFGGRIVQEKPWTFEVGHRRTDSGATTEQSEIQSFTQVGEYDVLIVADEANNFGDYLPDRTARPRPVAGTHGLTPVVWSRTFEQWGATQLQNRFERQAGRMMTERDYTVWMALRSVGEAATRAGTDDPMKIESYLRGPEFSLGAFKGQGLSFRDWDGQMRQPILVANARMLVAVPPIEGFLHPTSTLDTLGDDRPETRCRFN